jgi:hypothetical protein
MYSLGSLLLTLFFDFTFSTLVRSLGNLVTSRRFEMTSIGSESRQRRQELSPAFQCRVNPKMSDRVASATQELSDPLASLTRREVLESALPGVETPG